SFKNAAGIKTLEELDASRITEARRLKEKTSGIISAIEKISLVEKQNSEKGKELLNNLGNEIKRLNQGKKASQAYVPKPQAIPSYFIDKKK
ncbi:MAG: flagellar biosynthesis protein FlgN, partial [Clostridiales bacterium]|nr:flagellar biosynthesis protein FlgN [Clostridiales bacterium]